MIVGVLDHCDAESYIVEDGGEPAGHLLLRNHGFLIDVAVIAMEHQRRGGGTYALRWALQRAFTELKGHRAFLETREDNDAIRRFVERLGFVQEGTYRDGFQDERSAAYFKLCAYGMLEHEYRALASEGPSIKI